MYSYVDGPFDKRFRPACFICAWKCSESHPILSLIGQIFEQVFRRCNCAEILLGTHDRYTMYISWFFGVAKLPITYMISGIMVIMCLQAFNLGTENFFSNAVFSDENNGIVTAYTTNKIWSDQLNLNYFNHQLNLITI